MMKRNVSVALFGAGHGSIAPPWGRCYGDNVNRTARLRRLLLILSATTAQPGVRAGDLARMLEVSERTVFRDLHRLQRFGVPVSFGNGYPAQQELFRRGRRRELSQVVADLVDQHLEVVRRALPDGEADELLRDAMAYLPMEAAEAVTRAVLSAARGRRRKSSGKRAT
jgi:predicted DNA-binding transcriptional regulator YafY